MLALLWTQGGADLYDFAPPPVEWTACIEILLNWYFPFSFFFARILKNDGQPKTAGLRSNKNIIHIIPDIPDILASVPVTLGFNLASIVASIINTPLPCRINGTSVGTSFI